ncbi:MAG: response regulator transcription factor [Verrucomicrobia bacterium]|nr:response regulator transcription factor [Verrucomicrobiota bacterium]
MTDALIIDDEPLARSDLRSLLPSEINVVGEAGRMEEARKLLQRGNYTLVFLDVQLLGGSGLDLVPDVHPKARIIFVTAFDQHAVRAFEVNALDYLLKPVAPERLAAALARLRPPGTPKPDSTASLRTDDRVLLKLGTDGERFVRVADIRCVSSCENYSEVHLGNNERVFVRRTMKAWEETLPAATFMRAHRHTIVNLRHIERVERATDSTFLLHLAGGEEPLRASYRYVAELRERLASATGQKV